MQVDGDPADAGTTGEAPPQLVVALGASAGGLDALRSFFSRVPKDTGFAFVVAVHFEPRWPSMVRELLARHAALEVQEIVDGVRLAGDRIYVVPAGKRLTCEGGRLHLSEALHRTPERKGDGTVAGATTEPRLDRLFSSIAQDHRERGVGIVLSGVGPDGAAGVVAIRDAGGVCLAQEPGSAHEPEMPRRAITTGAVHYVLPVEQMPAKLVDHARRLAQSPRMVAPDAIAEELPVVCAIVRERTGHDFSEYKRNTLIRRLHRRIQVLHVRNVSDYLGKLRSDPREANELVKELLIGVTEFFRDSEAFEALAAHVLPAVLEGKSQDDCVRIWVPGCATGEEVYSIAIIVQERLTGIVNPPRVQIFATDADADAVDVARLARYPHAVENRVAADRLERWFVRDEGGYCVKKAIREMCVFSQHDVIRDPPFTRIDIVSCRNVLIYLEQELQKRVLGLFHYALHTGAYLLLGPSESVTGRSDLFRVVDKKLRVFQKKRTIGSVSLRLPLSEGGWPSRAELMARRTPSLEGGLHHAVERLLLEQYAPPCIVINEQAEIVYFAGRTGKFLEPPTGAIDVNIATMVQKSLRPDVRAAVHRAVRSREIVVHENVVFDAETGPIRLNIVVRPLVTLGEEPALFAVLFQELGPAGPTSPAPGGDPSTLIHQLENELKATKEHLQTTIEELETSNEELKSSNEELLSMNEELQSVAEEFETLNTELRNKLDELDSAHNDLSNLLRSTQIPTVFLDEELRIKRFTPSATDVFRLIETDSGRPITDIVAKFDTSHLVDDAVAVLRTLAPREREVRLDDGTRFYLVRTLPYRTLDNVIAGVVVTFVDVTQQKRADENQARLASIVESAEEAIYAIDLEGNIKSWNVGAERMFGWPSSEIVGRSIALIVPRDKADEIRDLRARILAGQRIERLDTVRVGRAGHRFDVSASIAPVRDAEGRVIGASAIEHDVSWKRRAEDELVAARDAAEAASRTKDEFLAVLSHELRTPLTPVLVAVGILSRDPSVPPHVHTKLQLIRRNAELEARLIDDLLDATSIARGEVHLHQKIARAADVVAYALEVCASDVDAKGVTLETDIDATVWLSADTARLQQALWNLLKNAVRFSKVGGTVRLRVSRNEETARIDVSDEGEGISPEDLSRLFGKFEQLHRTEDAQGNGLGLGLAIAKAIVEAHGGSIRAASQGTGKGSTFSILMPLAKAPAEERARTPTPGEIRVLLVEDHEDTLDLMRELLVSEGYTVTVATNAAEARSALEHGRFDLVISDLGLPDASGLEVARASRTLAPGTRAIALSGYGTSQDRERSAEAGFEEHLVKPVGFRDLQAAIHRLLGR